MLPVLESISVLGVSPAFGLLVGMLPYARLLAETSSRLDDWTLRPLAITAAFTWSGVRPGRSWSMSATAPATMGAAIDVPPARMYWPSTMQLGHIDANALFGARFETMWAPGASTSGFA
jgi:hypothetical protein